MLVAVAAAQIANRNAAAGAGIIGAPSRLLIVSRVGPGCAVGADGEQRWCAGQGGDAGRREAGAGVPKAGSCGDAGVEGWADDVALLASGGAALRAGSRELIDRAVVGVGVGRPVARAHQRGVHCGRE